MNVRIPLSSIPFLAVTVAFAIRAFAAPPTDCRTPRHAADSVFAWQQPGSTSLDLASRCLDPTGRTPAQLRDLARKIKTVYDVKVALVRVADLSDDPDWKSAEGRHELVPHERLPRVAIARNAAGDWLWTKASLDRILELDAELATDSPIDDRLLSKIPDSLRGKLFDVETWQYLALALLLVLGLVLRKIIAFVVASRVKKLVEKMGQTWASRIVDVFASPGATLAMAVVLRLSYPRLRLPIKAAVAMEVAVRVLVVLSIVWAVYRLVDVLAAKMAHKAAQTESKLDDQLVPLLRKALKVVTVILGAVFVLQNLSVDVSSLLAGLGIGGLAFALAAKDTLANFFGSVMIFVDRPFQIGDWVVVAGAEGVVEEVGFRSTRVRTFYDSLLTVPNAKIVDAVIDNYGERRYRRCKTKLGLTYDTTSEQMQAFVEGIRAIIRANPHTRKDAYEIHMSGFGESSLDVFVYFFFEVGSWSDELREKHNVFLEIMRLAEKLGVSFAFPTRTLHVPEVAQPGARRALPKPPSDDELAVAVDAFGPDGADARPGGPKLTDGYWPGAASARGDG